MNQARRQLPIPGLPEDRGDDDRPSASGPGLGDPTDTAKNSENLSYGSASGSHLGSKGGGMIPRGTRQALGLREVATRLGFSQATAKRWWLNGLLIGRNSGGPQARVLIPVEVVEFYLRYFRLPTKLELFECGALSWEFLADLNGPDGGLREVPRDSRGDAAATA